MKTTRVSVDILNINLDYHNLKLNRCENKESYIVSEWRFVSVGISHLSNLKYIEI
jgi:hypothetical protein